MNATETFQASCRKMTNVVLELVDAVKQSRVSAREALQKLDVFINYAKTEFSHCQPEVQTLMSPLIDFFYDARRIIERQINQAN